MKPLAIPCMMSLLLLASCGGQEPPSHDDIIAADLAEILTLQGLSCEEVASYTLQDRLDYRVVCKSGDVYRIHVSAQGHVMGKPHKP